MPPLAFISYRRDDTGPIVQGLYLHLKELFGSGQLFMDANTLRAGVPWPERIRERLAEAAVVLAVIGPDWLNLKDDLGERRIHKADDWVRNELLQALAQHTPIIPIVIAGTPMPDACDLPGDLQCLPLTQAKTLHLEPVEWAGDVRTLSDILIELGFVREGVPTQPEPSPEIRMMPLLTPRELADALQELTQWEEWGDSLTLEYPRVRQEIRRTLTFDTFLQAIEFMHFVAPRLEEKAHHPRWSNDWTVVRVRLTTWDVGNKITRLDVETARIVDAAYREFKTRSGR